MMYSIFATFKKISLVVCPATIIFLLAYQKEDCWLICSKKNINLNDPNNIKTDQFPGLRESAPFGLHL